MTEFKQAARVAVAPLGARLGRLGIHPNTLSLLGLALAVLSGLAAGGGHLRLAVLPLALSGLCDMLDGAVARAMSAESTFGAALDSTVDRVGEAALLGGLLLAPLDTPGGPDLLRLVLIVFLVASFLVSYTRARAEGLGLDCRIGLMERPARMILTGLILLLGRGALLPGFLLLSLLTVWTVFQRLQHIRTQAGRAAADPPSRKAVP
jgi:CDP-diacylglycerol--glycerol-3-phosphate 3-phosphatidyltransferase